MKKLLLLLLLLPLLTLYAQDIVVIKHTNYTTHYSKSLHYPVLVEWWETAAKSKCANQLARKDNFQPDPQDPQDTNLKNDYVGSGTDRGHMCPARENQCLGAEVQDECFYFSNMAAQYHSLNAGDWKSLETLTYNTAIEKDSVHIWAGAIGVIKKIGTTSVPKQCWKVVYVKKDKQMKAYLFNNDTSKPNGIIDNEVSVLFISKLTGFKFQ
jgi:endonuclease G, mitochondrial